MPLRPAAFREVRRKLSAAGFVEVTQNGSHVKFVRKVKSLVYTAIVPRHGEIPTGTLKSILLQAGITVDDFERL